MKESSSGGDKAASLRRNVGTQRLAAGEALVTNHVYHNSVFTGDTGTGDGPSWPEDETDHVQAPSQEAPRNQEVPVPLMNAGSEDRSSRGPCVMTRPRKMELIPLIRRAQRSRDAGAGSAAAEADPVSPPEAAIEAVFQLLAHIACPELAVDDGILLEDEGVASTTSRVLFGAEEANPPSPGIGGDEGRGAVDEEAVDALVDQRPSDICPKAF